VATGRFGAAGIAPGVLAQGRLGTSKGNCTVKLLGMRMRLALAGLLVGVCQCVARPNERGTTSPDASGLPAGAGDGSRRTVSPSVGKPAPVFTLESLTGKRMALADFFQSGITYRVRDDGSVVHEPRQPENVLLMLGCESCRYSLAELAEIDRLARSMDGRRLSVIAVFQGQGKRVGQQVRRSDVAIPVLVDHAGQVLDLYSVKKTPDICLITVDGILAYRSGGGLLPMAKLKPLTEALLAGKGLDGVPLPRPGKG